jgi:hypothetical protein
VSGAALLSRVDGPEDLDYGKREGSHRIPMATSFGSDRRCDEIHTNPLAAIPGP